MSGTGSSTGNLNHHLLNHWDKIDKQVKKQSLNYCKNDDVGYDNNNN